MNYTLYGFDFCFWLKFVVWRCLANSFRDNWIIIFYFSWFRRNWSNFCHLAFYRVWKKRFFSAKIWKLQSKTSRTRLQDRKTWSVALLSKAFASAYGDKTAEFAAYRGVRYYAFRVKCSNISYESVRWFHTRNSSENRPKDRKKKTRDE